MCKYKSMVIVRGQAEPIYDFDFDNHEKLIEKAKVSDDKLMSRNIVRVEVSPTDSLVSKKPQDWEYKEDEEKSLPDWYNEERDLWRDRCLSVICEIVSPHIKKTLSIGGSLYLSGTQIKELPAGLKVGANLYLSGTQIKELPQGLKVGGHLDLRGTQIKELPQGLSINGSLDLRGTQIKELPQGLKVGGNIYKDF